MMEIIIELNRRLNELQAALETEENLRLEAWKLNRQLIIERNSLRDQVKELQACLRPVNPVTEH